MNVTGNFLKVAVGISRIDQEAAPGRSATIDTQILMTTTWKRAFNFRLPISGHDPELPLMHQRCGFAVPDCMRLLTTSVCFRIAN